MAARLREGFTTGSAATGAAPAALHLLRARGAPGHVGGPMPPEIIEKAEMTRLMAEVLEELSEKERLVIALYYYEELTQKEISEVLSVSEGRRSQLHSQALIKLRVKLLNSELYEP